MAQHLLGTDRLNRWVKSREVRRRQLLERMYARLQSEEPLARRPVERVKNLSLAEFRSRYQKPGIPVVLEGAALASHSKTYYTR